MSKIGPEDQWMALNRSINAYKGICYLIGLLLLVLLIALFYIAAMPPVVIETNGRETIRHSSKRLDRPITEEEIASFVKKFIKINYQWEKLDKKIILKDIEPLVTSEFLAKMKKRRPKYSDKHFKTVSQYVGKIDVKVLKKEIVGKFDKIIRLNGTPLLAITHIALLIVQDIPSRWNPYGLYINGLIEYQEK
ncbi:hypothetical protein OAB57_03575 [Bacteriovoracaceae bacterium]|nr:hypothetical protein [Bacteriovoracaceae bacterium]